MLRPLNQTDYAITKQLFLEVFDVTELPYFIRAWNSREENATLGYWKKGALLGAAIVGANKLHYIFTHKAYRGSGIGTRLLYAVLARSPTIHLTPVDDPEVQQWYVKHGFQLSSDLNGYRVYVRHAYNLRHR